MKDNPIEACGSCGETFGPGAAHMCPGCERWVCDGCKVNDAGEPAPCSGTCKRCRGMLLPFVAVLPEARLGVMN